jgi:hypothetical protein
MLLYTTCTYTGHSVDRGTLCSLSWRIFSSWHLLLTCIMFLCDTQLLISNAMLLRDICCLQYFYCDTGILIRSFCDASLFCYTMPILPFPTCAGILEQSMGARNRVGIGLPYRPARLHRLAESFFGINAWAPSGVRLHRKIRLLLWYIHSPWHPFPPWESPLHNFSLFPSKRI